MTKGQPGLPEVAKKGLNRMPRLGGFFRPPPPPANEVMYANGRQPERTYASKTFPLPFPMQSRDYGEPTRYVWKVFDEGEHFESFEGADDVEIEVHVLSESRAGRKQIRLQVTRQAGNVRQIEIHRVPTNPEATELQRILTLDRDASARLILLAKSLEYIPIEGDEETIRVEDELLNEIFSDPDALSRIYSQAPTRFRKIVEDDPDATDIVALASRRRAVDEFRRLLSEPDYFTDQRAGGGREAVWQRYLERNSWILGVGLSGQLLTAWNPEKLEQTVAGFSVVGPGKRADALLRTSGSIRSLAFAEIKHHETDLLAERFYRQGCWPPSEELAGGVAQVQQTVHLAGKQIRDRIFELDDSGAETGESAFMLRPRSFLIIGHLDQLRGDAGGVNAGQYSSFEMYRRNLYEPEILTFDELLARAEWHVALAEEAAS